MKFSKAYKALRSAGIITIPFRTNGGDFVDVWASELKSGKRKGDLVIRIQWANSTSTLDEEGWQNEKKSSLMKHLQLMIIRMLK